jgi:hypothetical protein
MEAKIEVKQISAAVFILFILVVLQLLTNQDMILTVLYALRRVIFVFP